MKKINDTAAYFNQYFDVKDFYETVKDDRKRTCNITCIAMIVGRHPNKILQYFFDTYGINDKFMWEENLIRYLKQMGYRHKAITKTAWPKSRQIYDSELDMMKKEIDQGKIIFYHKAGHYQLLVGYSGKNFIFNDPAGDRKKPIWKRKRESGHLVKYPYKMVKYEKIYGKCWSIEI